MKRLIVGLAMVALVSPGVSQAQPAGKSLGSEFFKGWLTPVLSAVYFPVKFSVGTAGAFLGGISGWKSCEGNAFPTSAEGIWRPLTGGTYFITPQVLDGEKPFLPFDGGPYAGPPARPMSSGSIVQP
jgi:hypothetical protein